MLNHTQQKIHNLVNKYLRPQIFMYFQGSDRRGFHVHIPQLPRQTHSVTRFREPTVRGFSLTEGKATNPKQSCH